MTTSRIEHPRDWGACLREFGWLESVSDAELEEIRPQGRCGTFRAGVTIFSPTDSPSSVFLLRKGLVRIYRISTGGDEVTIGYVGPHEIFGELGGFGDFPRESYAMAVTDCWVCEMPQQTFVSLLNSHTELVMDVARQIGKRLKRIESRLTNLVFREAFPRMCATLEQLAEDFGIDHAGGTVIDLPLTQSELATLIGTSRQTVNAGLRRLEEEGVTARRGRRFVVVDRVALGRLADQLGT